MNPSWHTWTCFANSLYPYSEILLRMWGVEDTHYDEKHITLNIKPCFHENLFYQIYYSIANKIGFYAKEPYSLMKPHVGLIGLAWGGTLSTLCTHGITLLIIQSTMKKETTTATTMATLRSEASSTTSTACGWDGVTTHFIFPLSFLIVIKCHKALYWVAIAIQTL